MKNNNINMKFEEVNGTIENMGACTTFDIGNIIPKSVDEVRGLEARRINEVNDSIENLNECTLVR